jgi:hypothetical protein
MDESLVQPTRPQLPLLDPQVARSRASRPYYSRFCALRQSPTGWNPTNQYPCECVGCMNAPMIQSNGKKIPRKNIHPCPFRSVLSPSQMNRTIQMRAPIPIPHHITPPCQWHVRTLFALSWLSRVGFLRSSPVGQFRPPASSSRSSIRRSSAYANGRGVSYLLFGVPSHIVSADDVEVAKRFSWPRHVWPARQATAKPSTHSSRMTSSTRRSSARSEVCASYERRSTGPAEPEDLDVELTEGEWQDLGGGHRGDFACVLPALNPTALTTSGMRINDDLRIRDGKITRYARLVRPE